VRKRGASGKQAESLHGRKEKLYFEKELEVEQQAVMTQYPRKFFGEIEMGQEKENGEEV